MLNAQLTPATSNRIVRSLALRTLAAGADDFTPAAAQIDNGDEALYADKSGTYTKGILQTGIGLVDLAAYDLFKLALSSGDPKDFEKIILGGPRTLNGPQGGLAFYLQCLDGSQFGVPAAPALASEACATELVELYWASLLRDVAFTDYSGNMIAQKAATELSSLPQYAGPRDAANKVTPISCSAAAQPAAVLPGRRSVHMFRSFFCNRPAWDHCQSCRNTQPTKPASTLCLIP